MEIDSWRWLNVMSYIHFSAGLVCVKFISLNLKTNHITEIEVYITITNYICIWIFVIIHYSSESVNRRTTDNTMTKRKMTNNGLLGTAQETKIEQHEPH